MSVAARFEANASEDLSSPFYFNASHWRAMDGVVEGVKSREGIMVLTGPTGSGKTMLMRAISDNLGEGATPLFLQYASLNFREFVNFLHNSLNVGDEVLDASNKAIALRKFLYAQAERRETAVVFIDEAQNLEPDVLRMLPKLACFDQLEDGTNVGLQFMLTGGSELREIFEDSDFTEVQDAIAREYELRFFTREELKYFLEKRLAPLARLTPEPITDTAIDAVGKYTGGSPRLIGMICSHAMLFAAENPGRSIDESMIEEAAEALMIEPAENPFPDDDEDTSELAGPFSSADLQGETHDEVAPAEMSLTEDDDIEPSIAESPMAPMDDQVRKEEPVMADDMPSHIEDDFESSHMDSIVDEFDDDFEDGDFDDDDFDDDELTDFDVSDGIDTDDAKAATIAAAGAAGVAATKGGSLWSRAKSAISNRSKRDSGKTQIVGAGRKGDLSDRVVVPAEKRALKTRVAGQRQKQLKYAGVAAAFCALAFGGYMVRTDVSKVIASATTSVSETASSAIDTVSTAGSNIADSINVGSDNTLTNAEPLTLDTQEVAAVDASLPVATAPPTAVQPAKKSGWGAQVNVVKDSIKDAKLPEGGVSIARGALNLVDSALEKSKSILPEEMAGAIEVARSDVKGLKVAATANGASGEELKARVDDMVAKGDLLFERKLYIAPAGRNAYDQYRAVLDLDENNEAALRGIEKLRAFYSKKAEAARAKKQWDTANRFFETALGISQRRSVR